MSDVRVIFVDADTDRLIAGTELRVDQLPETFAIATTLHLGDEEYSVVRAEPETRSAIVAQGAVKIALRKLQRIDPSELRYSLPTIADRLPELGDLVADGGLRIRADDWCQIELVPQVLLAAVREELAKVRAIYAEQPPGSGFMRLHARPLAEPMRGAGVTLADLRVAGAPHRAPLALEGLDGAWRAVSGGFAFEAQGAQLYGVARDGHVETLAWLALRAPFTCVAGCPAPLDLGSDHDMLAALCDRHALLLVDWCAGAVLLPGVFSDD